jgi:hypothetical protein
MVERFFSFLGGPEGPWQVRSSSVVVGDGLPAVQRIAVVAGDGPHPDCAWILRGITSNERYVERTEKQELVAKQEGLGRPESTFGALIPIRKNADWWALMQDERRAIFEQQSRHIGIGMKYLPPIARRLHHCRDLSVGEPFDFITWFEYAPRHEDDFNALLAELRASPEWRYVDREVDIRLVREGE